MKMMHPQSHARVAIRLKSPGSHFNPVNGCQQSPAELSAPLNLTNDKKKKSPCLKACACLRSPTCCHDSGLSLEQRRRKKEVYTADKRIQKELKPSIAASCSTSDKRQGEKRNYAVFCLWQQKPQYLQSFLDEQKLWYLRSFQHVARSDFSMQKSQDPCKPCFGSDFRFVMGWRGEAGGGVG